MKKSKDSVMIDGIEYVPKAANAKAKDLKGMKYCIVRSYDAGVFAGYVEKEWCEEGVQKVLMQRARRLWYWKGAASLSQLSIEGVKNPTECKFSVETNNHTLMRVCEIMECTQVAQDIINSVPVWKK